MLDSHRTRYPLVDKKQTTTWLPWRRVTMDTTEVTQQQALRQPTLIYNQVSLKLLTVTIWCLELNFLLHEFGNGSGIGKGLVTTYVLTIVVQLMVKGLVATYVATIVTS